MNYLLPTEKFTVTHTLTDGEINLGVRAKIIDNELTDITNTLFGSPYINLNHIVGGLYGFKHTSGIAKGHYTVLFEIFTNNTYSDLSEKYGIIEEKFRVIDIVDEIISSIIPSSILRNTDSRLDYLNDIPNLSKESTLTTIGSNVISQLTDVIDNSDGGAV